MTLEEIKTLRSDAERAILKILCELNAATGLKIESVEIDITHTYGGQSVPDYSDVKIKLSV